MTRFSRRYSPPDAWIPFSAIEKRVGQTTWESGQELFDDEAVLSFKIEPLDDHWQVFGEVQGFTDEPYGLSIEVYVDMMGQPVSWNSECSCPVGFQCKHAVALLLYTSQYGCEVFPDMNLLGRVRPGLEDLEAQRAALIQRQEELQRQQQAAARAILDTQWLQWLETLEQMGPRSPLQAAASGTPSAAREEHFLYLLAFDTPSRNSSRGSAALPVLCLHLVQSFIKKAGGWSKVRYLSDIPSPSDPAYRQVSDADRAILELLRGMYALPPMPSQSSQWGQSLYLSRTSRRDLHLGIVLQGPMVAAIVQQAASIGRLFWALPDGQPGFPLQWGEPQTVQWHWAQQKASGDESAAPQWQLHAQLAEENLQLCTNQPPLYLDIIKGQCGPVQAPGWTPMQLALLLQAPPASEAVLENHQRKVVECLGSLPLPAVVKQITTLEPGPPLPRLYLAPVPVAQQRQQGLLNAQLRFDYQGFTGWWPTPQPTVLMDSPSSSADSVLLQRDLPAEQQAMERLLALGLRVLDDDGIFGLPGPAEHQQWLQWLDEDFAVLRAAGFEVTVDAPLQHWIARADRLGVQLQPEGATDGLEDASGATSPWFELSLGIEIDGQRHNILPLLPELIATVAQSPLNPNTGQPQLPPFLFLPAPDGPGFLRLPMHALQPWLLALFDLVGDRQYDFNAESLRLSRLDALRTSAALGEGAVWEGAAALRELAQQLSGQAHLPEVPIPQSVQASLRPYQQQGVNWLQFLHAHGLAGILADDMGLGKTLQTLVHIQIEKDAGRLLQPALIIAPVSLMGNWQREANRFCPQLRCLVLHGKERHTAADALKQYDVVIAPYSLLQRDRERWLAQSWHLLVLDEAQNIKNASTYAAKVVSALQARHRLCLSGTPMENHLGEIWSLFHFLMPGFLGSQKRFTEVFRNPIEKSGDCTRLAQLRARVTPFMLRRTKALVASDLPPKVETVMRVELAGTQANLYETIRLTMEESVREALDAQGLGKSQLAILDALLKLRQVCCDPQLVPLEAARKVQQSAKLECLMELLPEMLAEGRRILLFSQFTRMLELIEVELQKRQLRWVKLTGQSQNRDALIDQFTSGQVPLFLISLKAGGVGLNLPQADTVIHYDPWWNPAVENQATDRAHRIGQTQSVWVVKLVAQGTIEERILALQERKAQLADSMYSGASARREPMFTENDLAELLKPLSR